MRFLVVISLLFIGSFHSLAQATLVAILDFENISGIAKYDGLGKAMSSMLISDIEANVSPKRLQLVERAQIQKVLKEQNFQASGSVNKSTAVQAGKILGVNYLLVGDVYILNDQLIINARLTNTETGEIIFSKKQEGKTVAWLTLKTNIAKDLAASLSQPFIEPAIPDKETPVATITTFGNAVAAKDTGNIQLAESLSSTVIDFSPDFKYIDDLNNEISKLKERMDNVEKDVIEAIENPYGIAVEKMKEEDFTDAIKFLKLSEKNIYAKDHYLFNKKLFINALLGYAFYKLENYDEAENHFLIANEIYPWFTRSNLYYILTLLKLGKKDSALIYYYKHQNNVSYWYDDMVKISDGKIDINSGIIDGYDMLTDIEIGSRSDFAIELNQLLEEESLTFGVSILEIEYKNYLDEFKKFKINKQLIVNYNSDNIGRYFRLVNDYVWSLMKNKKEYNLSKEILIENLSLIFNMKEPEDFYEKKENYKIDLGNYGGTFNEIYETQIYFIGNLLVCYAVLGEMEKAKVLFCNLLQESIVLNKSFDSKFLVGRLLPPDYDMENQKINVLNILNSDFKNLNISSTKLNDIENCDCKKYASDWHNILGFSN
jgi:TolB-like protein